MTTTGATSPGSTRTAGCPERLRKRADFLRAGRGARFFSDTLAIQFAEGAREADQPPRIGLTITKKVGNAVVRNRIRRRLRETLRLAPQLETRPGGDYVLVARREALSKPFAALMAEVQRAVRKVQDKQIRKDKQIRQDKQTRDGKQTRQVRNKSAGA